MACDICGKAKECEPLNARLCWHFHQVICSSCAAKADAMLNRMRSVAWRRVKKKLKKMSKGRRDMPDNKGATS